MSEARIEIETDDGCLDALVASPDGAATSAPVVLLSSRDGLGLIEAWPRRLSAHGYYVLAPHWTERPADDRRGDADAWLDHLCDARGVDDTRVAVVGLGAGADLALRLAAWRSERIIAVAAFGGRGFGASTARDVAQRINGVVHLGYELDAPPPPRLGVLETAFVVAGVDFDVEIYAGTPDWSRLIDLLARTIKPVRETPGHLTGVHLAPHNP